MKFTDRLFVSLTQWQAYERMIARLLLEEGFERATVVGQSGDEGADILARKNGRTWLVQVKRLSKAVGGEVLSRTLAAQKKYEADVAVIASRRGFTQQSLEVRRVLAKEGVAIQLWDSGAIDARAARLPSAPLALRDGERYNARPYQETAIQAVLARHSRTGQRSALVVLATGLGKTFVAAESVRRIVANRPGTRVLVLAHANELVYQLEREFWPFISSNSASTIVNGAERPPWGDLERFQFVFASKDSLLSALRSGQAIPQFDVVVVDECHHVQSNTYDELLEALNATKPGGSFLIGLTATPWRPGGEPLERWFDEPVISVDLIAALQSGYLSNVRYRMYTDNVDWDRLSDLRGERFSPRAINRTLFIDEWDDAVLERMREAWTELPSEGRGIVFCGTIAHAERTAARINALGFTSAAPILSRTSRGEPISVFDRNKLLLDFAGGKVGVLCAVDVLNEGVDVPDVNLVVFQRVTHSRRIFVQQLGRGLRLAPGKDRVLVLDFVSDVRRFAAGLELKTGLENYGPRPGAPVRVALNSSVEFRRANATDNSSERFLREWIGDLTDLQDAGEDVSLLRYPPQIDRSPA